MLRDDVTDILFVLDKVLGWQSLFELPAFAAYDHNTCAAMIAEGGRFARKVLAPLNALGDRQGCRLIGNRVTLPKGYVAAYRRFVEGGWVATDIPVVAGGLGLPLTVNSAVTEMTNGACLSLGMLPCSTRAAAHLLARQKDSDWALEWARALASGNATATIAITEPQAGSHVRGIRSRAFQDGEGAWRLSGTKCFISYGDHDCSEQILHIVLAQTETDGERALSLFAVPKWLPGDLPERNKAFVTGIEAKMGLKGSPTCQIDFEHAVAWPIGGHGEGLRRMFTMMNLMRLDVSIQSVGLAQDATAEATAYAADRQQGGAEGQPISQFADVQRMLNEMRVLADAGRALMLYLSMCLDMAAAGEDSAREQARADVLLPICKAWLSDMAARVANLGIQVMGGHGYIVDHGMEQRLRDARVMALYEGTNGIQARDLVMRKLRKTHGVAIAALLDDLVVEASGKLACSEEFESALKLLRLATDHLRDASPQTAEAAATAYLHLAGTVLGGWMWVRIATADPERAGLAGFYFRHILPEAALHYARVVDTRWWTDPNR